jgi:hypothetical protein
VVAVVLTGLTQPDIRSHPLTVVPPLAYITVTNITPAVIKTLTVSVLCPAVWKAYTVVRITQEYS